MSRFFIPSIVGLLAHQLLFIRGEWHLLAPTVVSVHVVAALLLTGFEIHVNQNLNDSASNTVAAITCYLFALFTSIVCYRTYFHRLCHFPGPRLAAVSKLWHVWQCRDSRNHLVLDKLRQQYGPFVRTGEIPLSILNYPSAEEETRP